MKSGAAGIGLLSLCLLFQPVSWTWAAQRNPDMQAPRPIPPAEGRRAAAELLGNLLKLKPSENGTEQLLVKITAGDDARKEVPVTFSIVVSATNFLNIYEASGQGDSSMKLTIVHAEGQPNEYLLSQPASAAARKLNASQLMTPFAGSDFWIVDLGLEFLHWPDQRITKKQMRKNLFCDVLESVDPHPVAGGYSKVVSWVAANRPDDVVIVHADAYDQSGKLLKQFDPKKVRKVNGAWELAEMEILNRQTHSSTRIEFNYSPDESSK